MARHVIASKVGNSGAGKQGGESDVAGNANAQKFVKAMEKGDLETTREVFKTGDDVLKKYCGKQLVSLGESKLVELFNSANDDNPKSWIIRTILVYADHQLFDSISNQLKPNDRVLKNVMRYGPGNVFYKTDKAIKLLKRITVGRIREIVVEQGVYALVRINKPESLNSLISALQSEPTLSPFVDVAICRGFERASTYKDERNLIAKNLFDHPVVSAKSYSYALYRSYDSDDPKKEHFHWLLEKADRQDLEMAKKGDFFSKWSSEFRNAISNVLENVGTEGRIEKGERIRKETAALVMATLENVPKDLVNMILEYHFRW